MTRDLAKLVVRVDHNGALDVQPGVNYEFEGSVEEREEMMKVLARHGASLSKELHEKSKRTGIETNITRVTQICSATLADKAEADPF